MAASKFSRIQVPPNGSRVRWKKGLYIYKKRKWHKKPGGITARITESIQKRRCVCVCAYSTAEDKQQHSWIVSHDRDRSVSVSRMLWVLAPCMPIFTFIQIHHIPIQLVIYLIYVFLMIFCVSLSTVSVTVVLLGASSTLDHQKRPPRARPKHQKIPSFTAFLSFVLFLCWL